MNRLKNFYNKEFRDSYEDRAYFECAIMTRTYPDLVSLLSLEEKNNLTKRLAFLKFLGRKNE